MKWYADFDRNSHKRYYWSMRNERGQCFEIHLNDAKCLLYEVISDNYIRCISKHDRIQEAMDAASAI